MIPPSFTNGRLAVGRDGGVNRRDQLRSGLLHARRRTDGREGCSGGQIECGWRNLEDFAKTLAGSNLALVVVASAKAWGWKALASVLSYGNMSVLDMPCYRFRKVSVLGFLVSYFYFRSCQPLGAHGQEVRTDTPHTVHSIISPLPSV